MLLLTGATGTVGLRLVRRLSAAGTPIRCFVRDPARLGAEHTRVEIALGDLADPSSFDDALRGVSTVVHLASVIRDQPRGSIEELAGVATWRLVQAAERAGVERFVFFSTLSASTGSRVRFMRAKALAEQAVVESSITHTVFAPSIIYAPNDPYLRLLKRMSLLPVMPLSGSGQAAFQPIWAEDVADCVMAALPGGARDEESQGVRYELAGPETLTYQEIVELALRSFGRRRQVLKIPMALVRPSLKALETVRGPAAFATWDEVELLAVPLVARSGSTDAERLGVRPKSMQEVLGAGR